MLAPAKRSGRLTLALASRTGVLGAAACGGGKSDTAGVDTAAAMDTMGGTAAAVPRDELPLNREQRIALQEGLTALGFPTGNADGILGAGTRTAL